MSDIKVFAKDYPMAPIDKFIPYANNARTHSTEQINKLRSIYRGIGYGDPVEVDENFTILSGHGRVLAAKAEGMTELPYVMLTGMTEAEKRHISLRSTARRWMPDGIRTYWRLKFSHYRRVLLT